MQERIRARDMFVGSFNLMKTYAGTFWKILIPVLIVNIAINIYIAHAEYAPYKNLANFDPSAARLWDAPELWFLNPGVLIAFLASMLVSSVLAVGWHRRTILGEEFTWSAQAIFGKAVWLYLLRIILLVLFLILIAIVPYLIIVFVVAGLALGANQVVLATVIGIPAALALVGFLVVLFYRLGVSLPSYAIDQPIGFRAAYDATRGQAWMLLRLAILVTLISLLIIIPLVIIEFVTGPYASLIFGANLDGFSDPDYFVNLFKPNYVSIILQSIVSSVLAIYSVGLLTLLYNNFVRGDDSLQGDTSAL